MYDEKYDELRCQEFDKSMCQYVEESGGQEVKNEEVEKLRS
jgi:hypothetical protein